EEGVMFAGMAGADTPKQQSLATDGARQLGVTLEAGVQVWDTGSRYETAAGGRMLHDNARGGGGVAPVPQVIVARHIGLDVLGISCISNMAAGILDQPLNHEEVIETTENVRASFIALVKNILLQLA